MSTSTTTRIPISTTTLTVINTSSKPRGKARPANGSMTPATGVESPTRIRELPRSTIRGQAVKLRSPGRPIEGRPARVQEDRQVLGQQQTVVVSQAPRRWIEADSRMPSVGRTGAALRRWIVIAGKQAAEACPPNPPREAEALEELAVVVVPAGAVVVAVAVVAAVEEDKEEKI
jgi:hypothetical protein